MIRADKGLTLIEILIVLAISSILIGMSAMSVSMIRRANVDKTVNKLQKVIASARATTMAKGETAGELSVHFNGGKLYAGVGGGKEELISSGTVIADCDLNLDNKALVVTDSKNFSANIKFRTSGGVGVTDGVRFFVSDTNSKRCAEILVYGLTGKTEVNYLR